jgi:hypothetical protein
MLMQYDICGGISFENYYLICVLIELYSAVREITQQKTCSPMPHFNTTFHEC